MAIGARNGERYAPFVRFVDGIDARRAVALYLRVYPLLQQAYEDLGYPGKYFNDRVVEVIDNLLATPTPAGPIAVKRFVADGGPRAKLPVAGSTSMQIPRSRPARRARRFCCAWGATTPRRCWPSSGRFAR